jgi:flap endonuclease-1
MFACDASMSIYQFIIATQSMKQGFGVQELKDKDGNLTGHLLGLLNRSIMMMENGIKPAWVFDGNANEFKDEELKRRKELKMKAAEDMKDAIEEGDLEKQK